MGNRSSMSLDELFRFYQIAKYPVLTREEEAEISRRARGGDTEARQQLALRNLRFAAKMAVKYRNGLPVEDVFAAAYIGMLKAASRFDERRGFRFLSFARYWMLDEIFLYIADNINCARLPQHALGPRLGLNWKRECSSSEPGIIATSRPYSLDKPINGDPNLTLANLIPAPFDDTLERLANESDTAYHMAQVRSAVSDREWDILCRYYGIGLDEPQELGRISADCGVSRQRIAQIKDRAIAGAAASIKRRRTISRGRGGMACQF